MIRRLFLVCAACLLFSCESKGTRVYEPSQGGGDQDTDVVAESGDSSCPDGESCDDGIECTINDTCTNGACLGFIRADYCYIDGECFEGATFNPDNRCQFCSPAQDQENWVNMQDGQSCADGATCTTDDTCYGGECVGTIQDGYCLIDGQCIEEGANRGLNICLVCDPDYDPEGWRSYTVLPECDDNDPCTTDSCDIESGNCKNKEIPNDCGSLACGPSPSGCFECGDCSGFNTVCEQGECQTLVEGCADSSGLQSGAAWPMEGYCVTHQGRSPYEGSTDGQVAAVATASGAIRAPAAISASGRVFFGSTDGKLYVYNPASNSLECTFTAGDDILSTPVIHRDGLILFGCQNGNLYGINVGCNQVLKFQADAAVHSSPIVGPDGIVYFTTENGSLYAIDPSKPSGERLVWKWEDAAAHVTTFKNVSPAMDEDGNLFAGSESGYFVAVNASGSNLATIGLGRPVVSSSVVLPSGEILVATQDNKIYSLFLNEDFEKNWSASTGGAVFTPAVTADGIMLFPCVDQKLYALNPAVGTVSFRWSFPLGSPVSCQPIVDANGMVYAGTENSRLYVIDPSGAAAAVQTSVTVSSQGTGGKIWGLAMAEDGTLYLSSEDGKLYIYK